jgi:hypothetical protein
MRRYRLIWNWYAKIARAHTPARGGVFTFQNVCDYDWRRCPIPLHATFVTSTTLGGGSTTCPFNLYVVLMYGCLGKLAFKDLCKLFFVD